MTYVMRVARLASATMFGLAIVPRLASAQAQWTLVEELRIGAAETEATTFADVRGVVVGTNGQIFVLEFRTQEIRAFDATGKFIRNIARRGAGPGEIANANGLIHAPDGTIWVNDPGNSRFSVFKPDGSFLRQYVVPINSYGFIWAGVIDPKNRINDPVFISAGRSGPSLQAVRRVSPEDAMTDTVQFPCGNDAKGMVWSAKSKDRGRYMTVPFSAIPVRLLDSRGFVWCSTGDRYRIVKTQLGRVDTLTLIERTVPPVPVPVAERNAQIARTDSAVKGYETADVDYSQMPKIKPAIVDLAVDDAHRLWVRRSTNDANVTMFDVHDDKGALVATVRAPFKVRTMWRPVIRGDVFFAATEDEDDVQYVVRARIRK